MIPQLRCVSTQSDWRALSLPVRHSAPVPSSGATCPPTGQDGCGSSVCCKHPIHMLSATPASMMLIVPGCCYCSQSPMSLPARNDLDGLAIEHKTVIFDNEGPVAPLSRSMCYHAAAHKRQEQGGSRCAQGFPAWQRSVCHQRQCLERAANTLLSTIRCRDVYLGGPCWRCTVSSLQPGSHTHLLRPPIEPNRGHRPTRGPLNLAASSTSTPAGAPYRLYISRCCDPTRSGLSSAHRA